jgi:putative transposase
MAEQRQAVQFLVDGGLSVQRTCAVVQIHRSTFRYVAKETDDTALLSQMQALALQYPRYGYRRISVLINRTEQVNQKRVRRLWRLHRLQVRRVGRKRTRRARSKRLQAAYVGHIWAYDFVEDALADGTPLRILTVMDEFTREGLAIDVALTTSAERVIGVLTALFAQHGAPAHLRSDNGAEFVAIAVQTWLAHYGVQTLYIEPGKSWQGHALRLHRKLVGRRKGSISSLAGAPTPDPISRIEAAQKEAALVLSLERRVTMDDPQREGVSGFSCLPYAVPLARPPLRDTASLARQVKAAAEKVGTIV